MRLLGKSLIMQQLREKERERRRRFAVSRPATRADSQVVGGKIIASRWVLRKTGTEVKARWVVEELNTGRWVDGYAAAPTLLGQKLLVWRGLKHKRSFVILDVTTAFLHAPLPHRGGNSRATRGT